MAHTPRRALVTGGSSGIGRAIAQSLARDGCDVGILYLGDLTDADSVRSCIESLGRKTWVKVADVSDAQQATAAVEDCAGELGGLEVLVNNAGICRDQVIWNMTDAEWQDVIDIDLTGVFNMSRAAAPIMRAAKYGSIVNISSINGMRGKFGQTNYAAAKAGVIGFTKALAKELARSTVTVNAVAPGMIHTPILDAMPPEAIKKATEEILVGRIGTPEDIAEAVRFLCSEGARFITGEVLRVDGGQYI
ncbi:MAG: 3-oxoacyl-ACP reductase FabG [Phycisphaerales bacterium]|nr:3-oxoacyl-ACP reductase FabG [Phycisphaerales bacterium]MDP6889861.1 3-oxoacyl-ACP reductase FabG [Phycisphaerales bacterium]